MPSLLPTLPLTGASDVLATVLGCTSSPLVGDQIEHLSKQLKRVVPERADGAVVEAVRGIFSRSAAEPWVELFKLVAYFSSNNLLTPDNTDNFLRYVLDNRLAEKLGNFLMLKTMTTHAFATEITESGIRIKDTPFFTSLLDNGVKFESVLHKLVDVNDAAFMLKVLSHTSSDALANEAGSTLLRWAARLGQLDAARTLIVSGARGSSGALIDAVLGQQAEMVEYLLQAGADLSSLFRRLCRIDRGRGYANVASRSRI